MGAWSHEPFGNDTAGDWSYGLLESSDLSAIEAAVEAVLEGGEEYLEVDPASEAIAAIEVLAKLIGRGTQSDSYTRDVAAWVKSHSLTPSIELRRKAVRALDRITSANSELMELWQEGGDEAWIQSVTELRAIVAT